MSYNAYIAKITNVKKLEGSDFLQTGLVMFNPVVVGLDVKEGQIGCYFPDDGRLSEEYCEYNNCIRKVDPSTGKNIGGMFEENRKVRTQRIRKAQSVGYFAPLESLSYTGGVFKEGMMFTEINGHKICEKYVSTKTVACAQKKTSGKSSSKITYPFFYKHRDTSQLAYCINQIETGDNLIITEKLHGTSGRTSNTIMQQFSSFAIFMNNLLHFQLIKPKVSYNTVSGTRNTTLVFTSDSKHARENYRLEAHKMFSKVLTPGQAVYYEIVGYDGETYIQPAADNNKLKNKDFIKRYGKSTAFTYGCKKGEFKIFVYRLTYISGDGIEHDYSWQKIMEWCNTNGFNHVPVLGIQKYTGESEPFMSAIETLIDGESTLCNKHIMEGVVIRIDKPGWNVFKHKSFAFKVFEDIIKLEDNVDTEESS